MVIDGGSSVPAMAVPRHRVPTAICAALEELRVIAVSGVVTGVLVIGVGSRAAMLLLRVTSPRSVRGVTSDDGFTIGEVTLGGTANLLVIGAAAGVLGAFAYRTVRPWLIGPPWFRRTTVAAASGAVVGSMLVHPDGVDFTLLQPAWLAVGLFVALPAAFGWAVAVAVDRIEAAAARPGRGRWRTILPPLAVVAFPPAVLVLAVVALAVVAWHLLGLPPARDVPAALRVVVRGAWLAVAAIGAVTLAIDANRIL